MRAMTGYDFFDSMSQKVRSDIVGSILLATEPFSNPATNPDIPAERLDADNRYISGK